MLAGPPDIIYKNRQSGEEIGRIKTLGDDVTIYTNATSFADVGTGASISQGRASTPQERAQRLADYRASELTKDLKGFQIHEINSVKFGGSPTDLSNKILLTPSEHAKYTNFWN
ncbi:hypothetical protein M1D52_07220 [Olivibacter sp. SA151]|uniref:hypothetical protein n=1 Tax=Olivibacter jilunii TaxID=985016 RepID=UPI003F1869CD